MQTPSFPTRRSLRTDVNRAISVARRARSRAALSAHALSSLRADLVRASATLGNATTSPDPVADYVTSPTSLFGPLRLAIVLGVPLLYPLSFIPVAVLLKYATLLVMWYLLCVCFFATEIAMRPPWYHNGLPTTDLPPYWKGVVHDPLVDLSTPFKCVSFKNAVTGHTLRGWFIQSPTTPRSTRAVVFVHGAGRDRRNFLRHAIHFLDAGVHCLLFDTSEHGLSDVTGPRGRGTSFGAREEHDVAAAVHFVRDEWNCTAVAVVGTSTGASSAVLAAAGALRLTSLACVVAENPFTRADSLLIHHLSSALENYLAVHSLTRRRARSAVFWLAGRVLLWRMGQYWRSRGPVDVVAQLECPILVAHSTADDVVPFSFGKEVYERAATAKQSKAGYAVFFEMHDAAHCALYDKSPSEWVAAVLPFVLHSFDRMDGGFYRMHGPCRLDEGHVQASVPRYGTHAGASTVSVLSLSDCGASSL